MRELPIYQCDAFASAVFRGNPAAVCLLPKWPEDELLAQIAAENNLSETAFLVGDDGRYQLRWFTPTVEVDLCGHATLASAHVVFERLTQGLDAVQFDTRSGELVASRLDDGRIELDFPARAPTRPDAVVPPPAIAAGLGTTPAEIWDAPYWLAVFESEAEVAALAPDMRELERAERPVICTAPGADVDFVSRFFGPTVGVPEDPVTGSAHCTLAPYWAERLGRSTLRARQISKRVGEVACEVRGDRVALAGGVALYLEGVIRIPT